MPTEREVKLGAWAGFTLPDLDGVVDHVSAVARRPLSLSAVYFDTPDLRLLRWGATLRHRGGDRDEWTVKLPEGEEGPALVRRELSFDGPLGTVPAAAANLVTAYARGGPLAPVARIRTQRTGVDLVDGEGTVVAEVVDDEVSVLHAGRVATRFREVEVELRERAPAGLMEAVIEALREAGAGEPDATPKLVRALGARAQAPPDVARVPLGKHAPAREAVADAIAAAVIRILRHDPGVRVGDDPEDVHQVRVGTRRLRSDLRTFGPLLDREWAESLRDELGWVGAAFGEVRDVDVLEERFRGQAAALPAEDAADLSPVFRLLAKRGDDARADLLSVLGSERYLRLVDRLVGAAREPACRPRADAPAAKVLRRLVARPWGKLAKTAGRLPATPRPEELHRLRIATKRARYAVEAAAPVVGKKAGKLAAALADLQTVLGDHHDAVVAEQWLRAAAGEVGDGAAAGIDRLVAVQVAEAEAAAAAWRAAWKRARAGKLTGWL